MDAQTVSTPRFNCQSISTLQKEFEADGTALIRISRAGSPSKSDEESISSSLFRLSLPKQQVTADFLSLTSTNSNSFTVPSTTIEANCEIQVPKCDSPFQTKPCSMKASKAQDLKRAACSTINTERHSSDGEEPTPTRKFTPSIEKLRTALA